MKTMKTVILNVCAIWMNGHSSDHLPIHLSIIHDEITIVNMSLFHMTITVLTTDGKYVFKE